MFFLLVTLHMEPPPPPVRKPGYAPAQSTDSSEFILAYHLSLTVVKLLFY